MHVYIISYDLKAPGRDYSALYDTIKSFGNCQHPLESTWVVASSVETPESLYTKIKPTMDNTDLLLIFEVMPERRQGWLARSFWEWINKI